MRYLRLPTSKRGLSALRGVQAAILAVAVLAVGYQGYGLYTTVTDLRAAQRAAAQERAAIAILASEVARRADVPANFLVVEPPLESGKFMSTFIRQITDLSTRTGSELKSIKPKPMPVAGDSSDQKGNSGETVKFEPVEVKIEMLTDYAGINAFVAGLSDLPKVVKVAHFDLARRSVDTTSRRITLEAKLTLVLCMLKPTERST